MQRSVRSGCPQQCRHAGSRCVADLAAAENFLQDGRNGLDVIRALAKRGFRDIAEKILQIQKLRISGDYLQTSAVVLAETDRDGLINSSEESVSQRERSSGHLRVLSALNDANDYQGPGTGYRLSGERWQEVADIPQAKDPKQIGRPGRDRVQGILEEIGEARSCGKPKRLSWPWDRLLDQRWMPRFWVCLIRRF